MALSDHLDALDNTPDPADQADSEKGLKDTGNHQPLSLAIPPMMEPTPSVEHAQSQRTGNEDVDDEEDDSDGFVHLRNITQTHDEFKR